MIITLLAAPRIVKLPAIVLPAARAIRERRACLLSDKRQKRATNGTFETNWLRTTLVPSNRGKDVTAPKSIADWKKPLLYTLCINTNIAAKNARVGQSMARTIAKRCREKRTIGIAAANAMSDRGTRVEPVSILTPTRARIVARDTRETAASLSSLIPYSLLSPMEAHLSPDRPCARSRYATMRLTRVGRARYWKKR